MNGKDLSHYLSINENALTIKSGLKFQLYDNALRAGEKKEYTIPEVTFTLKKYMPLFILVDYNDGSPKYRLVKCMDIANDSNIIRAFFVIVFYNPKKKRHEGHLIDIFKELRGD